MNDAHFDPAAPGGATGGATAGAPGGTPASDEPPPRPAFFRRLWMILVQPGELFRDLVRNPAWFPVTVLVALVVGTSTWLLPIEAFDSIQADIPAEQREQMPDLPPGLFRAFAAGGALLVIFLFPVIISLATAVIFVFIRGDRATYRQHLCVNAHTGVIAALGALFLMPLRMRGMDFQETLSVGSFFGFLPDGYLSSVLAALDLFSLWSCIVAGIGLAAIDPRRSPKSTAIILVGVLLAFAMIRALF